MNFKLNLYLSLIFVLIIAVACNTVQEQTTENQAVPETLEEISIQLSWIHEYSVAPFHEAAQHGGFAEQGLDATLAEGGFNDDGFIDPIEEVVSGEFQFGLSDASNLIVARSQGKPVVALLAVLQRSPFALLSLDESEILRPQDLVGKTVSVSDGGARQTYDSLLVSQNIDADSIDTISRTDFGIGPLLNGDVDVMGGWIINEGVSIEEAGESFNAILMSDYAVDSYSFVLFTSEEYLENNQDTVQRTVDAITDAMRDVIDDPEHAIEYTLIYNEELDHDAQLRRLNATIPLMNVPGVPLGFMDAEVWEISHQILLDNNVIEDPIDLSTVYTTEFISNSE